MEFAIALNVLVDDVALPRPCAMGIFRSLREVNVFSGEALLVDCWDIVYKTMSASLVMCHANDYILPSMAMSCSLAS
jgi:hypothetical protein